GDLILLVDFRCTENWVHGIQAAIVNITDAVLVITQFTVTAETVCFHDPAFLPWGNAVVESASAEDVATVGGGFEIVGILWSIRSRRIKLLPDDVPCW